MTSLIIENLSFSLSFAEGKFLDLIKSIKKNFTRRSLCFEAEHVKIAEQKEKPWKLLTENLVGKNKIKSAISGMS